MMTKQVHDNYKTFLRLYTVQRFALKANILKGKYVFTSEAA